MKTFFYIIIVFFLFFKNSHSANWCKAIYKYSDEAFDGNFQNQLSLCKNSDNLFVSISSKYKNSAHLLNATIANFCDLNRNIIKSESQNSDQSYFSAVCVFRKHNLRTK